jgi:hypothetical protein
MGDAESARSRPPVEVAVTDHAVERFRQRVGGGSGALDVRPVIVARVRHAWDAGSVEDRERGTVHVSDLERKDLVYVCRWDRPRGELLVITLWEASEDAAVPRLYTDELRRMDRRSRLRQRDPDG